MGHHTASAVIAAPAGEVFGFVDDWRNATAYMAGLSRFEPTGEPTSGVGATFEAAMDLSIRELVVVLRVTEWEQDRHIVWAPVKYHGQRGSWTFEPDGSGTRATFDVEFDWPGGIGGKVLERTATPLVRGNLGRSVQNLKREVESTR